MNAISPDTAPQTLTPDMMMRQLINRITNENEARIAAEKARVRRELKRARIIAEAGDDPLAQHPRLVKLREELIKTKKSA